MPPSERDKLRIKIEIPLVQNIQGLNLFKLEFSKIYKFIISTHIFLESILLFFKNLKFKILWIYKTVF